MHFIISHKLSNEQNMVETILMYAVIVIISLSTSITHLECKDIMSYDYPVYETDSCPGNKTEWNKRSSALNCTKLKGYICLPNEAITSLLEFCYIRPTLTITKDTCLYLDKSSSKVNDYNCTAFSHGCPTSVYQSDDIYKYPGCTLIGHGCFLAEPFCKRSVQTSHRSESLTTTLFIPNGKTSFKNINAMEQSRIWLLFTLPVVAMVFLFSAAVFFYCHMRYEEAEDDNDISESEDQCKSPLSEDFGLPSQAQRKDVKGNFGSLSKACLQGDFKTVEKLLKGGAAINVKEQGFSPLHISCYRGHTNIVKLLLEKAGDVNLQTEWGDSPLHLACQMEHNEIIKLLLSQGADVNLMNSKGLSPLYVGYQKYYKSIINLIHDVQSGKC